MIITVYSDNHKCKWENELIWGYLPKRWK